MIGTSKFSYDVWGETVNLASRLESAGQPGAVTVSQDVARRVPAGFAVTALGRLDLKGQRATPAVTLVRA